MFAPVKIWQIRVRTTTVRMQSRQFQRNIYWDEFVQEYRNFRFMGIWDVSAEWSILHSENNM